MSVFRVPSFLLDEERPGPEVVPELAPLPRRLGAEPDSGAAAGAEGR